MFPGHGHSCFWSRMNYLISLWVESCVLTSTGLHDILLPQQEKVYYNLSHLVNSWFLKYYKSLTLDIFQPHDTNVPSKVIVLSALETENSDKL